MTNKTTLKECPFCESKPFMVQVGYAVRHKESCFLNISHIYESDCTAWNTRSSIPRAVADKMRDALLGLVLNANGQANESIDLNPLDEGNTWFDVNVQFSMRDIEPLAEALSEYAALTKTEELTLANPPEKE